MGNQIHDEFIIQLVGDISTIRTTVSNLKEDIERIDEKVAEPFVEWLHKVKSLGEKVDKIETDLGLLKTRVESQETYQKESEHKIALAKWYAAGFVACAAMFGVALYKIVSVALQFLVH